MYYDPYSSHVSDRQRSQHFLSSLTFVLWRYEIHTATYVIFDVRSGIEHRVPGELSYDPIRFIDRVREVLTRDAISSTEPPKTWIETRIVEINVELDIIKGRVPTPKGYKIDKASAKRLMKELQELSSK